jgi:drug/metabolite transporter (DMT)-like permease
MSSRFKDSQRFIGTLCILLGAIGFSGKAVIIKLAYVYPVDPGTLMALRMLLSAPFFLVMAFLARGSRGNSEPTRRDWLALVALGFTGYYLAAYLDFLGLQYVSASMERLILFLYPTLVLLLSAWLLKKALTLRHVFALLLSYGGIALVFSSSLSGGGAAPEHLALGAGLVFASGCVYAFYLIGAGEVIARFGAMRFTAWAMLAASCFCLLQFVFTHGVSALHLPRQVYVYSAVMAVLCTVLPAVLMSEGIRRCGANHAALVGSVGPVATIALGKIILDEPVNAQQLFGSALVLSGVTLVSLRGEAGRTRAKLLS